jgi:tRNA-2-methylthio-N6-dimethylallyladenosine synthase
LSGAFSFKYSSRPGTPGAGMDGQIDEAEKSERLQRLQEAIDFSQAAFNRRCLDRTFDVLFERPGRYSGLLVGRSPYLQPVQVAAPASLIGEIAGVTVTEVGSRSLFGTLAEARVQNPLSEAALLPAGA